MFAQAPMENNDDGWDLFAVVRSCRAGSRSPQPSPLPPPANTLAPKGAKAGSMFSSCFPSLTASGISHGELEKLCKPFFSPDMQPKPSPRSCSSSPSSARAPAPAQTRRPLSQSAARSKRGRSQQKRVVCQVPADGLAADMWAWRKYGQKPIKGSPFPRGYYRCSSLKGCLARKQVERSRSDAGMFVITYTGEHNHQIPTHRNSLAGSTRQKIPAAAAITEPANQTEGSPNTPLKHEAASGGEEEEEEEEDEEEEGVLLVEDMEVVGEDEVLFMGVEELQDSSEVSSSVNPEAIDAFFGNGSDLAGGFLWSENSNEGRSISQI